MAENNKKHHQEIIVAVIPAGENNDENEVENNNNNHNDNDDDNEVQHQHRNLSELTAPRQVRAPSSVCWRFSVWFLLVWGIVGTVCSFVFSVQALFVKTDGEQAEGVF